MDIEKQFQEIVDSVADTGSPSDQHRRQLRQQVLAGIDAARSATIPETSKRKLMIRNRVFRWSALAAAVLVCVAAAWFLVETSMQVAWADVQNGLAKAQSVTMKVAVYQGQDLRKQEQRSYLDANRIRVESKESTAIIDRSQGKVLVLVAEGKKAYASTLEGLDKTAGPDPLAALKKIVGSKDAKDVGDKTIDGQPCKGWQLSGPDGVVTVWANNKTAQIVHVEIEQGAVRTVMSDFDFSPKLDEAQFSLKAPEGYTQVVGAQYNMKDAAESDVILLLRAWAGGNGGVFPSSLLDYADWYKAATKFDWSQETQDQSAVQKAISRAFFRLNAQSDWIYNGKGVKLGDSKTPIFWSPLGSGKYRVIYGDLKAGDVEQKYLPKTAATTSQPAN